MIIRVQCSSCWLVKNEKISRVCNDSLFYIMFITVEANLRAAPELSAKVLHPGNCKQNVPVALAIFSRSTATGIRHHFPDKADDAASFLHIVDVWWTISNSKSPFNIYNSLGNAAVLNDKKPEFLRAFADWIDEWDNLKLPNCDKFNLTAQTSHALRCTLRCHAALLEELLSEGYSYVLTSRFQSDPLEKQVWSVRLPQQSEEKAIRDCCQRPSCCTKAKQAFQRQLM